MVSPGFFERFLGEKGISKRNRLILTRTGAVVGARCSPTSISGVSGVWICDNWPVAL